MEFLDKHGHLINEGDTVRYYDSTRMWLTGCVISHDGILAVTTCENPIRLRDFTPDTIEKINEENRPLTSQ